MNFSLHRKKQKGVSELIQCKSSERQEEVLRGVKEQESLTDAPDQKSRSSGAHRTTTLP